jgi:predicted PurR-regulated permease PerM
MNLAAEILVVILSTFLAVFLILGIVLLAYLISLTRQIRKITQSAEGAVNDLSSAISNAVKYVSPIFISEMVAKFFKKFKKDKEEKSNDKE